MENRIKNFVLLLTTMMVLVSCKTKTETPIPSEENTVLVQLKETATSEMLIQHFEMADLQHKKLISKTMRINLFTFNSQKIALEQLLEQLKASELVEEAQANQSVSNRN